jgi:Spy/CpxP family protein refolding chaperone
MNTPLSSKQKFSFKQVLLASFLAISLPTASIAYAERGGDEGQRCERGNTSHHGMHEGKSGMSHYLRGLDLSGAQQDQLFTLNHEQAPTVRNQHKQHQQLMEELRVTAQADKFDDAKVQQLADKIANLEKDKVIAKARHDAKVFALLTPEQRKKAREFKMEDRGFDGDARKHGNKNDDHNKRPAHFKQPQRTLEYSAM